MRRSFQTVSEGLFSETELPILRVLGNSEDEEGGVSLLFHSPYRTIYGGRLLARLSMSNSDQPREPKHV